MSLESLPVEILRKIFFYSTEINLPLASPIIGAKLSEKRIYKSWLRTFFIIDESEEEMQSMDHEAYMGRKKTFRSTVMEDFRSSEYPVIEFKPDMSRCSNTRDVDEQRQRIAQKTLDSNWCTLPLIRECQLEFLQLVIRRIWLVEGVEMMCSDEAKIRDLLQRKYLPEKVHRRKYSDWNGCKDWDLEIQGYTRQGRSLIWLKVRYQSGLIELHRVGDRRFREEDQQLAVFRFPDLADTGCEVRLPLKVYQQPWTEEKGAFIELLRNSGVGVHNHQEGLEPFDPDASYEEVPYSHEQLQEQEFVQRCIRDKNLWALDLMLADSDNYLYTFCYMPLLDDLSLAITSSSKDVIRILCKRNLREAYTTDELSALREWAATETKDSEDKFAAWLIRSIDRQHEPEGNTRFWKDHRFDAPFRFLRHLD
jgi:hypothetical protein